MFTREELRELARACRAHAVKLDKDAEQQKGTSAYSGVIAEAKRFRGLAAKCEAQASTAPTPAALALTSPAPSALRKSAY